MINTPPADAMTALNVQGQISNPEGNCQIQVDNIPITNHQ